ncbi:hypothetical protein FXO38_27475 [Capsicum annuum]|nr:hypothetical protein FXO37_34627 [Capsicum annuum]KAF3629849.1 hypothetical protein FXO38_27475 [Capsicum annuum]
MPSLVTKNKSITAAQLIILMKGNRLNNKQKLKCALVSFMHEMLLAKNPSKKVDSDHIKMAADLELFGGYPWGKESFEMTLSYLKKKTNLTKQKEAFVKRNNASYTLFSFPWAFRFRYMRPFLIWEGTPTSRWILPCPFTDFFDGTHQSATTKWKATHLSTKEQHKAKVADEDEDLGGPHYVPIPPRACDHAGSSGLKTSLDASNDDDLRKSIALLEKSLLDIASFVRDERLRRIEKNKKKKQEEVELI